MQKEELISVIVPVYNVEKYLSRCIESILHQTYHYLEIIIVDDGSTDNSGTICDSYLSVDDRIRVFHKTNGGLSSARNFGIEQSNGELLAFIDSDDLLDSRFFEVLIKERFISKADIVSTDLLPFFGDLKIDDLVNEDHDVIRLKGIDILKEYFLQSNKELHIYHGLCMKIYEKSLFSDLRFEEGRLHEDLYITYQLLRKARIFSFIPVKYYFYFKGNTSSICFNFKKKNFIDKKDAFEAMICNLYSNEDIQIQLIHFLILQYLDLISNGRRLKDSEVNKDISNIKTWIRRNLKKDKYLSATKKMAIRMMLVDIKLYDLTMKIRKRS